MSKKQKKNPNKIPATPEMAAREADRAYYCAIANVIDSIAETGKYTFEEIEALWDKINDTADKIASGTLKPEKVLRKISEVGIDIGHISHIQNNPRTIAEVKRNAKAAYKLACAIMLYTLISAEAFSREELSELWARAVYKKDSIDRKYTTLRDVCDALLDDYGISVATGVKL